MIELAKNQDVYQKLRKKVAKMAESKAGKKSKYLEYLLAAPDLFHLVVKLTVDPDVDAKYKVILGLTVAYFVSPVDLIPDIVPIVGILDDVAIVAFALNGIICNGCSEEVLAKHWAGNDQDILNLIKRIINVADEMLGSVIVDGLKKILKLDETGNDIPAT